MQPSCQLPRAHAYPENQESAGAFRLYSTSLESSGFATSPVSRPQLATVKVGGDRDNPLMVREGVTSKQIMEELRQKILETGLLPSGMVDVNAGQDRGRRWPRVTGRTRTRLLPCR
jgi:hypothetical protein